MSYKNMFEIIQKETNPNQIVNFKSLSDSQRYWNYFVENKNVVMAKYVNPLLIADIGYTVKQLRTLDFLNCILPIPIFSKRFIEKNGIILDKEMEFYPCKIKLQNDEITDFFIVRILNYDNILDTQHSGRQQLTDGTYIPDIPYMYKKPRDDFYIVRDVIYKNHYLVSHKFKELCSGLNLLFKDIKRSDNASI